MIHLPRHVRSLVELSTDELELVAEAWRHRAAAASATGFPYVHAFVNDGHAAGASLPHSHSQLVWLREPPPAVVLERDAEHCRVCSLIAAERADGSRLLAVRDELGAICPPAGRVSYEMLIAPVTHDGAGFGAGLGPALSFVRELMTALQGAEGHVAWNAWLHLGEHWHVEIVPRLAILAGIELGAGIHVLTVAPEDAAATLRDRLL